MNSSRLHHDLDHWLNQDSDRPYWHDGESRGMGEPFADHIDRTTPSVVCGELL
jgi:hypothetical protein